MTDHNGSTGTSEHFKQTSENKEQSFVDIGDNNNKSRKVYYSNLTTNIKQTKKLESAIETLKGALSGLRHFLASENPLKMIKNAQAFFVLKVFNLLS